MAGGLETLMSLVHFHTSHNIYTCSPDEEDLYTQTLREFRRTSTLEHVFHVIRGFGFGSEHATHTFL